MGYSSPSERLPASRLATIVAVSLLLALLSAAWSSPPASASPLVARDGKIHACYKARGKAKGTLRVVRSARARCPRHWRKVAWNAGGSSGSGGENGAAGEPGQPGSGGANGGNGTAGVNGKVSSLESQVTELLTKLKSLEGILAGVTNSDLKGAIGTVPVVTALCAQTSKLTDQTTALGSAMGAMNTAIKTVLALFSPPPLPLALPSFSC
jgi:hypothetical protein